MSASVATREFLTHLGTSESRQPYLPILIPAMCLNRFVLYIVIIKVIIVYTLAVQHTTVV